MEDQVTLVITGGEIKPVITVPASSTIRQLKRRIREELGVPVREQRLLYGNIWLVDNTNINDYIHGGMAEVFLSVDLNWENSIIGIFIMGETFLVQMVVSKVDKVIEVKERLGRLFVIDPKDIDLWHLETEMEDDKMLYKYYVDEDSEVRFTKVRYGS